MALYFVLAFSLFLLALGSACGNIDRRYETALAFCITFLAYVASFVRWDTGTDWASYFLMYDSLQTLQSAREQTWWGPGYSFIAVLINSLGGGYTAFLFCIATILFAAKFHILRKSCAAPLIAIFVLFCTNFYDIFFVRQHVAVVFFWIFSFYFHRKSYGAAYSAALGAFLFHYSSALPIAIVVILTHFEWKKILPAAVCAVVVGYILVSRVTIADLAQFTSLTSYVGSEWVEEKASDLSTTSRGYLKIVFWLGVVAVGYLWFSRKVDREQADWNEFCLRSSAGILVVSAVLLSLSEIFSRLPAFAFPLLAAVLSNYKLSLRSIRATGAAYMLIVMLMFVQLAFSFNAYPDAYYPFKWFIAEGS